MAVEALIVTGIAFSQRVINACQSLLRAQLGQRVNEMILVKAQTLSLGQFEDSEFYDKLTRARREASVRPLALVNKTFLLAQLAISLVSFAIILWQFSILALLLLFIGGLPVFFAEAKYSGEAFRLFRWRSPDTRQQLYIETLLAREDSAKEVKLFELGPRLLNKYRAIFQAIFKEDSALTIRRETWGFILGCVGAVSFYAAYIWIILSTISGQLTLGEMTMYLLVFKQGQANVSSALSAVSGMYEDNLYLSNLYEYLEQPVPQETGTLKSGCRPNTGLVFDAVSFTYPGAIKPALNNVSFTLHPGQKLAIVGENGSGKTTLIKLLTRLYLPSAGVITLDGTPLNDWDLATLRRRTSVIFQDFMRYQFTAGENLGAGNDQLFHNRNAWQNAAEKGLANDFIEGLTKGYDTQLGRWFKDGQELSGGQWQKIALSRVFIRPEADLLILDEPTSAVDARAEAQLFELFHQHTAEKMAILISHRFSTVRNADHILVLDKGAVIEQGDHEQLIKHNGLYAQLYNLQAKGFQD
ncbi:ABC transporter ATP-binding protein [Halioxenophilus sp. WMMB6]|uniref:ABC transporter ATP-binding protein n=1 Tax=Halioxenophilus sp. WMMB6 TaxID=3073815 RepID=UPI00295F1D13|nr:ABC transporter ATP-binding protein [Halioxenophilus sp. WMMB6]